MTNGDMKVGSNKPITSGIQIKGKTNRLDEDTEAIKNEVSASLNNTSKPENERMEEACSTLMDLWLEDNTDAKLNQIMSSLYGEMPGSEILDKFTNKYLKPSVEIMSCISGGSKVADKYDYTVEVNSAANLKNLGLKFSLEGGNIYINFAPGVTATTPYGHTIDLGTAKLSLPNDLDGVNTTGVKLAETEEGFQMTIDTINILDNTTHQRIYNLSTVPNFISSAGVNSPQVDKPYTKGTRYAVISKDDIFYEEISKED